MSQFGQSNEPSWRLGRLNKSSPEKPFGWFVVSWWPASHRFTEQECREGFLFFEMKRWVSGIFNETFATRSSSVLPAAGNEKPWMFWCLGNQWDHVELVWWVFFFWFSNDEYLVFKSILCENFVYSGPEKSVRLKFLWFCDDITASVNDWFTDRLMKFAGGHKMFCLRKLKRSLLLNWQQTHIKKKKIVCNTFFFYHEVLYNHPLGPLTRAVCFFDFSSERKIKHSLTSICWKTHLPS